MAPVYIQQSMLALVPLLRALSFFGTSVQSAETVPPTAAVVTSSTRSHAPHTRGGNSMFVMHVRARARLCVCEFVGAYVFVFVCMRAFASF